MRSARAWHALTGLVAWVALFLQFYLVATGSAVLDETDPPTRGVAITRFFAYFTIQSNLLIAVTTTMLAVEPHRDGAWWRPVRLAGLVGITVTGVVHFFLLRPLLSLEGADLVADKLLHLVVPLLAVTGWALLGPRPRLDTVDILSSLVWPILWLGVTLSVGATSGWYPYPFLDPAEGGGFFGVALTCLAITGLFVALALGARAVAARQPPSSAPAPSAR